MSANRKTCVIRNRRVMLKLCAFFAVFALLPGTATECRAQATVDLTAAKVKALLRCPTPDSRQFVDDAFKLVQQGKIPEKFLLSAFNYAYNKPKNQWWYFEWLLDRQCREVGIDLAKLRQGL